MDSWHDDIKTDEMQQEFLRFFRALIPKDKDLFFNILSKEYAEIKKREVLDSQNLNNTDTEEYIDQLQQEVQEVKNQTEAKEFINQIQEEVTTIKNDELTEQNTKEAGGIASTQTQEQAPINNIEAEITRQKEKFITDNKEELEALELINKDNSDLLLYSDQMTFPNEIMNDFKQELQNNPNAHLDSMLNMTIIKENLAKEREFQEIFTQEVASLSDENPSLEKEKKLNPDNYFQDLINWFDKKKLENENIPLTKQEFKEEFLEYCKSGMSENEMKILLLLANKEPSKLTKEHKDMINDGLKFNLTNAKLLDKGLETAIKAEVGENLINSDIDSFQKSIEKLKNSENLIDKKMMEGTTQKLAQKLKDQTPNITPQNAQKLNFIAQDKQIPNLQKSKGKSR